MFHYSNKADQKTTKLLKIQVLVQYQKQQYFAFSRLSFSHYSPVPTSAPFLNLYLPKNATLARGAFLNPLISGDWHPRYTEPTT